MRQAWDTRTDEALDFPVAIYGTCMCVLSTDYPSLATEPIVAGGGGGANRVLCAAVDARATALAVVCWNLDSMSVERQLTIALPALPPTTSDPNRMGTSTAHTV